MQFKAVEVMPQITRCSLARHAPTTDRHSACQRLCLALYAKMTREEKGRETRGRGRNQRQEERWKKRWKKDGNKEQGECLNCKWVNVTDGGATGQTHDGAFIPRRTVSLPRKRETLRSILSFYVQFPRHRRAHDKWKSRGRHPKPPSLSLCLYITHTQLQRADQLFSSRAARWGLIPAIPQLIPARI